MLSYDWQIGTSRETTSYLIVTYYPLSIKARPMNQPVIHLHFRILHASPNRSTRDPTFSYERRDLRDSDMLDLPLRMQRLDFQLSI